MKKIPKTSIAYKYGANLYINLTNRCASACVFCIKNKWRGKFRGSSLRLKREPSAAEVISAIKNPSKYDEVVFCGYGEPLIRLNTLLEVTKWLKSRGSRVRINTSGLANLYHKRNILPELYGLIDSISISLNAQDASTYNKLHKPFYGKRSFAGVKSFVRESVKFIPEVTVTCIEFPGTDINKCAKTAKSLGAGFRKRDYLDEYEDQ
jgi:TatD DNase family protein